MANNQKKLDDFFKKSQIKEEPEGLKEYISDLNQGVDPSKLTFADRIAGFFKNLVVRVGVYYPGRNKKEETNKPSTFRRKLRILLRRLAKKFADKFNFEAGVDILDDTSVLYRRNLVNKNIMIVSNFVFIIFALVGNQNPRYALIAVFALFALVINTTLKKIIHEEPRTLIKQQMAMYIGSIYILFGSFAVYMKLKLSAIPFRVSDVLPSSGTELTNSLIQSIENDFISRSLYAMTDASIAQAGYILIYFALVVIALYQDSKLLKFLFKWVLAMLTALHLFVLYPLYQISGAYEFYEFLFITNKNVLIDIGLRTLLLVVFYIALYSSVSIGEMMNNRRKEELVKRRSMETDFKAVVGDVFDVIGVFNSNTINQSKEDAHRVAELASRLASVLGLSSNVCTEIYEYSVIHIDKVVDLSILEYETKEVLNERDYQIIREKTILGSIIIKRLQLNQKSEDIIRAHFEKTVDSGFTERMKRVQRSQEGEVILLAEMYDILRQSRNYKNKLKHKRVVDLLQLEFKEYFEPYILDRFMKYQLEFEAFYDKYKYVG